METKEPKKQDVKILNNKCEPEMCFIRAGYVVAQTELRLFVI